jgi:6-pyruvoyltetrahydropterin/6-carboxytetrahydropterin synthase
MLTMYRVTKEIWFCYGHRLLNYNGKCAHLHGHNGKAVITVETDHLDPLGMVVDFSTLKKTVGDWINSTLDHTMILHKDDPLVPLLEAQHERHVVIDTNPTAENLARLVFDYARSQGFPVAEVTLWETENSFATYRPTI